MFDDLHDSILEDIRLTNWPTGRLELRIMRWKERRLYAFQDVRSLKLRRTFDWGSSDQINTVRTDGDADRGRIEIEMRSGDPIEIEYRSCQMIAPPAT